ncbi:hypothetical protein PsorP6_009977 [Peronosclerospora sorghi]|uniref:Uncharacterized protein n=1 Tax=Peronosclerospora sorghi TaxID=230839 RepID=A0ACC0VW89_9STRA|nr:hypothetical protein PsorP6_009977 [Peronosclerospora sorghi]
MVSDYETQFIQKEESSVHCTTRHMSPKQPFLPLHKIEQHAHAGAKTEEEAVDPAGASSSSSPSDDSSSSYSKFDVVFATITTNFVKRKQPQGPPMQNRDSLSLLQSDQHLPLSLTVLC